MEKNRAGAARPDRIGSSGLILTGSGQLWPSAPPGHGLKMPRTQRRSLVSSGNTHCNTQCVRIICSQIIL